LLTRRLALGALCVATAGAAALGISIHPAPANPAAPALANAASLNAERLTALDRANRSLQRTAPATPSAPATPAVKPSTPAAKPAPKPKPKPAKPAPLPSIPGLTRTQVNNAWAIVLEGHRMGINARGQQIAIATAMQESNLYNLTRAVDHDSLGLFQQRPSSGWGSPRELTNPTYAAHAFYAVLVHYKGAWGTLWRAAQDVQRSAFPYAYQKHSSAALRVVTILDKRF
jgi:hypothetical protein